VKDLEFLSRELNDPEWKSEVEVFASFFMKQLTSKELPVSGNGPALQLQVDNAKTEEIDTLTGKTAIRIVMYPEVRQVRLEFPDRIMGSRFVITRKCEDGQDPRIKARWVLKGHQDPDLMLKFSG